MNKKVNWNLKPSTKSYTISKCSITQIEWRRLQVAFGSCVMYRVIYICHTFTSFTPQLITVGAAQYNITTHCCLQYCDLIHLRRKFMKYIDFRLKIIWETLKALGRPPSCHFDTKLHKLTRVLRKGSHSVWLRCVVLGSGRRVSWSILHLNALFLFFFLYHIEYWIWNCMQ